MTALRRSLLPALLAAGITLLCGAITLASRGGNMEARVAATESNQARMEAKLDRLIEAQQATREAVAGMRAQLNSKQ